MAVQFNWLYVGNNTALTKSGHGLGYVDPYNPLNLPPYTIRIQYHEGYTPGSFTGSWTQVSSTPNIWDCTYTNPNWSRLLYWTDNYLIQAILGANTTGVTNLSDFCYVFNSGSELSSVCLFDTSLVTDMSNMYNRCNLRSLPAYNTSNVTNMRAMLYWNSNLQNIPLLDTSNVTNMEHMLGLCYSISSLPAFNMSKVTSATGAFTGLSIESIPNLDTSKVENMQSMFSQCSSLKTIPALSTESAKNVAGMFSRCYSVQSGALALYNQMSTQANPPVDHWNCFKDCGRDTVTGQAELAQIPSDWK